MTSFAELAIPIMGRSISASVNPRLEETTVGCPFQTFFHLIDRMLAPPFGNSPPIAFPRIGESLSFTFNF